MGTDGQAGAERTQPPDGTPPGLHLPTLRQTLHYIPGFAWRVLVPSAVAVVFFAVTPTPRFETKAPAFAFELTFIVIWLLVAFPLYLRHQLRSIHASDNPQIRWIESLIVLGALFVAIFAHIYRSVDVLRAGSFTQPMDALNSYYYTMTVLSTVGFGDIAPVFPLAKSLTIVQMVCDIALIGLVVKVLSSAARAASSSSGGT